MTRVAVTGANGHLGFHIASALSSRGYEVVATVRDELDSRKTGRLSALRGVEIRRAELLDASSWVQAFEGVDAIVHSAAPNFVWSPNPQADIVKPIFEGTQNVFKAAVEVGARRLVFTSSASAVGLHASGGRALEEDAWNESSRSPLLKAKIDAERWAWQFAEHWRLELNTICPPSIVGPGFERPTPTTKMYVAFLENRLPPLPRVGFHIADVRDVAAAHVAALETNVHGERFLIAGEYFEPETLFAELKSIEPTRRVPGFVAPRAVVVAAAGADWLKHKLTGAPRELTVEMADEFVGKLQKINTAKARTVLGWNPRPARETFRDMFAWIRETARL